MKKLAIWAQDRPHLMLSLLFVVWKSFILIVAVSAPGIGYDTSTDLLASDQTSSAAASTPVSSSNRFFHLVRWDAIYYTQMARHGLIFEQQWAFGIGVSSTISFISNRDRPLESQVLHYYADNVAGLFAQSAENPVEPYIYTAIGLSHLAHYLATILLFSIVSTYIDQPSRKRKSIPFIAAVLYIVSPAGIFLSAPQSESTFACINMLGIYLYIQAVSNASSSRPVASILRLCAGISFGVATVMRSNGILSGIIFLLDAFAYTLRILSPSVQAAEKPGLLVDLQFTVIAGSCIAVGLFMPQYLAYQEYCSGSDTRPWCKAAIPSIFTFVQAHYWNVGFLRYWTMSNLPLFLLAAPQLYVLITSGLVGCSSFLSQLVDVPGKEQLAVRLALPQLILAVLALFSYHVQIISRLSSGYPFWYIWLATKVERTSTRHLMRAFIIYGIIQASLYAAFLPPA